jgi:molecular chaperone GrpE (heat shock protein)
MNNPQFPEKNQLVNQESATDSSLDPQEKISQSGDVSSVFIQQAMDTMIQSISRLQADFETKIKYDDSKERTIDALHRELQDYREDLSFKILRPLIVDLVSLYDDLNLLNKKYSEPEPSLEASKFAADLKSFVAEIEEIVSRYGFEFYQVDADVFDRSLQKIQKVVNTDNRNFDKQIVDRVRQGLRYGDRIVRPEMVTAYRYVASSENNTTTSSSL